MKQIRFFDSVGGQVNSHGGGPQNNAKLDYFIKFHLRPGCRWQNPRFWIEHLCCYISHKELEEKLLDLGYAKNKDGQYKIELYNIFCVESKDELPSMDEILVSHKMYVDCRNELLHPFPVENL